MTRHTRAPPPVGPDEAIQALTLEAGQAGLRIAAGTAHEAYTLVEPSIHLTIGLHRLYPIDILCRLARAAAQLGLAAGPSGRKPEPPCAPSSFKAFTRPATRDEVYPGFPPEGGQTADELQAAMDLTRTIERLALNEQWRRDPVTSEAEAHDWAVEARQLLASAPAA